MYKVIVDAGHFDGCKNRGPKGFYEDKGVLAISKYLKADLELTGAFYVVLTRSGGENLSLTDRAKIAIREKADLFISEHTDAFSNPEAGGCTVFHSVDIPEDAVLAATMSNAIAKAINIKARGAKTHVLQSNPGEDYLTVIDYAQDHGVPHILLIESAFHTNPREEEILLDNLNLQKIAKAQAEVICSFFHVNIDAPMVTKPVEAPKIEEPKVKPSASVLEMQHLFNLLHIKDNAGKPLAEDGLSGPATKSVIRRFQEICNLEVDGNYGPITRNAVNHLLSRPTTGQTTTGTPLSTRYIQYRVAVKIDGSYGPLTKAAVKVWQRNMGLETDGIVGPKTWKQILG